MSIPLAPNSFKSERVVRVDPLSSLWTPPESWRLTGRRLGWCNTKEEGNTLKSNLTQNRKIKGK